MLDIIAAIFATALYATVAGVLIGLSPVRAVTKFAAFTGAAFFAATFFTAVFFATAGASFFAADRFAAHRFFVDSEMAFRPAALNLRFGIEGSGVAFDGCLAGGFFAVPEDAWTASFARMTAAFASRSRSRM